MKHDEQQRLRAKLSTCVAALCLALVALTVVGVSGWAANEDTYYLTAWRYGAIAWVQTISHRVGDFTDRLTQAADHTFTFWGLDPPSPPESWEHPEENPSKFSMTGLPQIRKKDPSTNVMWRLDPLWWRGEQVYPLLVIAFHDLETMRDLLSNERIVAMFTANATAISGAELWLRTLLGCPRIVLCDANDSSATLAHEFAHWLFFEWYAGEGGHMSTQPPRFVREGMAEVTAAQFQSATRPQENDDCAREWLVSNRLADRIAGSEEAVVRVGDVFIPVDYVIGESFVRYLVELLTPLGFLETAVDWGSRPDELIELYEPGWREWLGLPAEHGQDQSDAEE